MCDNQLIVLLFDSIKVTQLLWIWGRIYVKCEPWNLLIETYCSLEDFKVNYNAYHFSLCLDTTSSPPLENFEMFIFYCYVIRGEDGKVTILLPQKA